ncbi:conserved hypothetical protein [Leishmania braziliensis MHOM/BR/75/M2904]|uniref:Crossover junction endonuclease MUS81 n=2 Tax=Leishmania braziliensis TaxID=5660 RepID=A4HDI9_LEIBR|nr:conserved hypothetical protein [Leishmania braziliensis MHOM/BR/75/M2904]CAJ2473757.1 unnamed protein product [Leishmania braziliensis]CAM42309.2 conserved hypothetical protein [Leishmania braziliensis MHOM/BR/75/M2904]SYZ66324.1 SAP_domain/ERCC4_domain_containing_protein [Leishmania braziliensis MHOM/BR/75/M2904]
MAESQSHAPASPCAGAADDAVAASEDISVNACLCKHLLQNFSQLPQPQLVTSAAFLDALARYPLPVVSAATAHDIAGSEQQRQAHQLSVRSPSQPPSEVPSEPAADVFASPIRIQTSTASLPEEGYVRFSDPAQDVSSDLIAAIHQFWAPLSASEISSPPLPSQAAATEEDPHASLPTAADLARRSQPPPPPPWAAFSPFRFCADPSFRAALRGLPGRCGGAVSDHQLRQRAVVPRLQPSRHATGPSSLALPAGGITSSWRSTGKGRHGEPCTLSAVTAVDVSAPDGGSISFAGTLVSPWTVMDAWCHGLAADGGRNRKRTRTATATSASPTSAEAMTSTPCRRAGIHSRGKATAGSKDGPPPTVTTAGAQDPLRTNPSPDSIASLLSWASPTTPCETADVLQRRVAENDNLLDLLLGAEQSASRPPELAGRLVCPRARLTETTRVTGAEPNMEREDDGIALAESNCGARPSLTETTSTLGTFVVHVDADEFASISAQRGQMTTSLATTRSPTTALMRLDPVMGICAETDFSYSAGDGSSGEHVLISSVKDLRNTCARLGLLSTGSKATLQQRLHLHYTSAPPPPGDFRAPLAAAAAKMSPLPHVSRGSGATRQVNGVGTSRFISSPPRTVFRYRSPSQSSGSALLASAAAVAAGQTRTCTSEAVTAPATRTATAAAGEPAAASASPTGMAAGQRGHFVPSPTQFLHDFASRKPQTPPTAPGTLYAANSPASVAAERAQQAELTGEMGRVRWQWLVDFRERASAHRGGRRQHEGMLDVFRKQHVPCTSMMLPAGDFMLSVELSPEEAASMHVCGVAASTDAGAGVLSDSATTEGAAPVLSHVCSLVVERKTSADLDASVKGTRYAEQRRLLAASPFRLVVWLIEGADVAGGGGSSFSRGGQRYCQGGGGTGSGAQKDCRSSSPALSSPAESARQRVDSACASLGLHGKGWMVVRTRSTTESVQFLKLLATQVARQLAGYRFRRRCAGEGDGAMLSGTDVCVAARGAAQHPSAQCVARIGGGDACFGNLGCRNAGGDSSKACMSAAVSLLELTPTNTCLQSVSALQRRLRAKTAFLRMLMCVRGCSAALASLLASKYGTMLRFWRELRRRGQEACDADPDIQRLTTAQKKVYVLLTEFLLAKDYY